MKGWESLPFDLVSSKPPNKWEGCLCTPAVQLSPSLLRELFLMYRDVYKTSELKGITFHFQSMRTHDPPAKAIHQYLEPHPLHV